MKQIAEKMGISVKIVEHRLREANLTRGPSYKEKPDLIEQWRKAMPW